MQRLNPLLTAREAAHVAAAAQEWQRLCVLEDKLRRCLLCVPGARLGASDARLERSVSRLVQDLLNERTWREEDHPAWLAFEVLERIEIRAQQHAVAQHLLGNIDAMSGGADVQGAIVQCNMGEGKTRVILPMLVMALAARGGRELVRLDFLGALLADAVAYYTCTLSGAPRGALPCVRRWRNARRRVAGCCSVSDRRLLCVQAACSTCPCSRCPLTATSSSRRRAWRSCSAFCGRSERPAASFASRVSTEARYYLPSRCYSAGNGLLQAGCVRCAPGPLHDSHHAIL